MRNSSGKGAWIFIALIGLIGFGLLRKYADKLPKAKLEQTNGGLPQGSKQAIIEAPAKPNVDNSFEQARRNYNIAVLNGITKVPSSSKGDKILVTIAVKPEAQWCKNGDFDLIKSLATHTKERLLTMSLEAIEKKGVSRSKSFNLGDLNGGQSASFEIPSTDGTYGLYLCSDQSRRYTCSKKKAIPTEIWTASPEKIKKLAVDKIFYFQLLHVKDGTVNIIPSDAWGKDNLRKLKANLGDWMGDDVAALDKMDSLISQLQPMPARLTKSKIEIPLPYNDLRCLSH